MTQQQSREKNHGFWLLLIPLAVVLAIASGERLFPGGLVPTSAQTPSLDQYSIQCLACHGDKAGIYDERDAIVVASNQILHHGSLNHSIGRSYAAAFTFGGYRPIEKLSSKIQLPNGMVSCISCHDGNSKKHGELVTTTKGSALCFECRDL